MNRTLAPVLLTCIAACGLPGPESLQPPDLVAVSATDLRTCGLTSSGEIYCWGAEDPTTSVKTPLPLGLPVRFSRLAVHGACGIREDGGALCWSGVTGTALFPLIGSPPLDSIYAGSFPCGTAHDGAIWCWPTDSTPPVEAATAGTLTGLAVGDFACGLTATGHARCFGGILPYALTPVQDSITWKRFVPMHGWACGIRMTDSLVCFTFSPLLVTGPLKNISTSPITDGTRWAQISGTDNRAVILSDGGRAYFISQSITTATAEGSGKAWQSATAGSFHDCGQLTTGAFVCFGANGHGQLGDGTLTDRPSAVLVGGGTP